MCWDFMKNIVLTKRNGFRYTDSVRDRNPLHEGKLVAGMWLASHIQGRNNISSIKQIKFSGNVFYEDTVVVDEVLKGIGKGRDFIFRRGEEVVCSVNGVKMGEYTPTVKPLKKVLHVYDAEVCPERVALYMKSIGFQPEVGKSPEMYLASLSAPALLHYGSENGFVGAHASQSFNMHEGYKEGVVKIAIGDERVKGPLHYFDMRWLQDERIVASGRAGVLPISKDDLEKMAEEFK